MTSANQTETINGVPLKFTLDGPPNAPTVTFAHALSLNLHSWDSQVAAFAENYQVLRVDMRGHGGSDPKGGAFSIEDLADDVAALLDHLGIQKTHFVGSSLGAMVGFALAFNHPKRLASLVFMASQGALPEAGSAAARERIATMRASDATPDTTMAAQADATIARLMHNPKDDGHGERTALMRDILGDTTLFGQARAYEAILNMNYDSRLSEIHTPTLIVAGAEDSSTPSSRMQMYADGIAGARMEIIKEAGHFPNIDQPNAFNALLNAFVREISA
ncbi:MAG: alpha/beta fold hydrolase [Alphaproteobacteria bacterium]|nr:alpha/beta fold hydrolase [Alphaproteobacteria bacterium]